MLCTKCNSDNPADALFCMKCGSKVENRCSSCSTVNPVDANFCRKCGAALASSAASLLGSATAAKAQHVEVTLEQRTGDGLDGERKTVTALFADIKDSTEMMRDLDPEEARGIVDPALKIMVEAVRRYGGYVVQSTGDGIFALFGAPTAYEDHPQRALYAALKLGQELREYGQRLVSQGKPALEARVGINTGEVVVRSVETGGKIEYTPIGHTANLASRLQTLAPAGSIAVSEHTRRLVEGYVELRALGPMQVRGLSELVNVYEVTGLGPLRTHFQLSARRGLTKFVGRDRELAEMRRALESAMDGRGQIVAVVADAGTGKSRLFYEFKATLPAECKVLEAYSVSHGKASAWLPVLELLRGYFTFRDKDNPPTRRDKVRAKLSTLDPALADMQAYLFALLGIPDSPDPLTQMDPPIKRQRTLDAIKRIILHESLAQPVVVIFEDLHWIDSQTQALLDLLADGLASARVLLMVNYRPEYRHEWGNKSYYSQLRLDALDQASAAVMLDALLTSPAPVALPAGASGERSPGDMNVAGRVRVQEDLTALKRLIIERTEGNPFFIEEMLQAMFDEGVLVRNGVVEVTRSLSQLRLPATVQGILASRIDRQPGTHKQLLQTLAVLGKQSSLGLIRQVVVMAEAQLARTLADLQTAEFIYEQPATAGVDYTFKHALTQEVAYNSLLIERRREIHERAAQSIEGLFAANIIDQYGELARHYGRSGNGSQAVKYLRLAAEQAMARSAYAEARDQLDSALELLRTLTDELERDRTEIALRLDLNLCRKFTVGFTGAAGTVENLELARELCERVGDDTIRFEVLDALAGQFVGRLETQKIRAIGEELLTIATRTHNSEMVGGARSMLGAYCYLEGNFAAAVEEFEQARQLPAGGSPMRESMGWDWRLRSRSIAALPWWALGFPERAMARTAESFEVARQMTAPPTALYIMLVWSSFLHMRLRNWQTACASLDEAIRLCHEHGFIAGPILGGFFRGWCLARLGQVEDGLAEMLRWETVHMQIPASRGSFFWGLADVYLAIGRSPEGLKAVDHALEVITARSCEHEAELRRLKGELLLMGDGGAVAEAARCFGDAIELARRQRAKAWELRATMSLARLLAKQGSRDEACTMLAEIYGWFTEGFDIADLKDAKALLDELNG